MGSAPLRVVIAPDSFKGSLRASGVARAIAAGWRAERPQDELDLVPMADGGEGTLDSLETALPDARRMPLGVTGPDGRRVAAHWLLLADSAGGSTGVVELAACSGMELLERPRPLDAHTIGFGEAVRAALDHGVDRLLLAIGGSSSTDGGAGALSALGARLLDHDGAPIGGGARGLAQLAAVSVSAMRPPPPGGAVVLSDVAHPLLGPQGAATVFGPQKGLVGADAELAERALGRWARLLVRATGAEADLAAHRGAGAAGGTGFGLLAWGATLRSGARAVAEAVRLDERIATADLVVCGEGRFDATSSAGKAVGEVARLAADAAVPVVLVSGAIAAPVDAFAASLALDQLAGGTTAAITEPERWLREAGSRIAKSRG
ncbi:glycerate kinase [Microcella alkalica]|uniref:glycerate kinase n=1 Tax=Microcella alkalica TaxID=355930 RepID=UPI002948C029|nr:glycerate kinase [Microcella alkalica]